MGPTSNTALKAGSRQLEQGYSGKKAGGGKVCRGMGAATQGGKFRIS